MLRGGGPHARTRGAARARVALALVGGLALLAIQDLLQTRHSVRRVYPLLGRRRYLLEQFGPELRQYIVTNDLEERPFSRAQRSWGYQIAKGMNSTVGFGTQQNPGRSGYFHFLPSPFPALDEEAPIAPPSAVRPTNGRTTLAVVDEYLVA